MSSSTLSSLSQKDTCNIIYEHYRRKKLEKKRLRIIQATIACILSLGTILLIAFVNYDQSIALKHGRYAYLDTEIKPCANITYGMIDLISTPIAIALLTFYVFISKRRVFLKENVLNGRIGLPMITTTWNKSNRFYTALVYGLIAHNIYEIVLSALNGGSSRADADLNNVKDPTGIVQLLFRLTQVILVGISKHFVFINLKSLINLLGKEFSMG